MPSCDPALLVDMVADASRGGGRSVPYRRCRLAMEGVRRLRPPGAARLKRHTSFWFNSSARNLCDIPDTRSTQKQGRRGLGLEAQCQAVRNHLNGGAWKLIAD